MGLKFWLSKLAIPVRVTGVVEFVYRLDQDDGARWQDTCEKLQDRIDELRRKVAERDQVIKGYEERSARIVLGCDDPGPDRGPRIEAIHERYRRQDRVAVPENPFIGSPDEGV